MKLEKKTFQYSYREMQMRTAVSPHHTNPRSATLDFWRKTSSIDQYMVIQVHSQYKTYINYDNEFVAIMCDPCWYCLLRLVLRILFCSLAILLTVFQNISTIRIKYLSQSMYIETLLKLKDKQIDFEIRWSIKARGHAEQKRWIAGNLYSRVRNRHSPLNKCSLWKIWKKE